MIRYFLVLCCLMFAPIAIAQEAPPSCPEGYVCTINDSDTTVDQNSTSTTTVKSPPPSAIAPSINSANSDLCTVGVSGAVQTQILGISAGKTVRDMNCEKLKNAKVLYDMGMKVAAVSVMCQDERVFDAMMNAGTPCPYDGLIGSEAKAAWAANKEEQPDADTGSLNPLKDLDEDEKSTVFGGAAVGGLLLLLLL